MLTSESVAEGVALLGSAFRRRVSAETTLIYHRILHDKLDQKQFETAVREAIEHEEEFPTVSKLLKYGEAISTVEGTPHVQGVPLAEYLERARTGEGEP